MTRAEANAARSPGMQQGEQEVRRALSPESFAAWWQRWRWWMIGFAL
jgi:hypothetical protein